jgi:hypothetical protein
MVPGNGFPATSTTAAANERVAVGADEDFVDRNSSGDRKRVAAFGADDASRMGRSSGHLCSFIEVEEDLPADVTDGKIVVRGRAGIADEVAAEEDRARGSKRATAGGEGTAKAAGVEVVVA